MNDKSKVVALENKFKDLLIPKKHDEKVDNSKTEKDIQELLQNFNRLENLVNK